MSGGAVLLVGAPGVGKTKLGRYLAAANTTTTVFIPLLDSCKEDAEDALLRERSGAVARPPQRNVLEARRARFAAALSEACRTWNNAPASNRQIFLLEGVEDTEACFWLVEELERWGVPLLQVLLLPHPICTELLPAINPPVPPASVANQPSGSAPAPTAAASGSEAAAQRGTAYEAAPARLPGEPPVPRARTPAARCATWQAHAGRVIEFFSAMGLLSEVTGSKQLTFQQLHLGQHGPAGDHAAASQGGEELLPSLALMGYRAGQPFVDSGRPDGEPPHKRSRIVDTDYANWSKNHNRFTAAARASGADGSGARPGWLAACGWRLPRELAVTPLAAATSQRLVTATAERRRVLAVAARVSGLTGVFGRHTDANADASASGSGSGAGVVPDSGAVVNIDPTCSGAVMADPRAMVTSQADARWLRWPGRYAASRGYRGGTRQLLVALEGAPQRLFPSQRGAGVVASGSGNSAGSELGPGEVWVHLVNRLGSLYTYPAITGTRVQGMAFPPLPPGTMLDGEVVWVGGTGFYVVRDVLCVDGRRVWQLPLWERLQALEEAGVHLPYMEDCFERNMALHVDRPEAAPAPPPPPPHTTSPPQRQQQQYQAGQPPPHAAGCHRGHGDGRQHQQQGPGKAAGGKGKQGARQQGASMRYLPLNTQHRAAPPGRDTVVLVREEHVPISNRDGQGQEQGQEQTESHASGPWKGLHPGLARMIQEQNKDVIDLSSQPALQHMPPGGLPTGLVFTPCETPYVAGTAELLYGWRHPGRYQPSEKEAEAGTRVALAVAVGGEQFRPQVYGAYDGRHFDIPYPSGRFRAVWRALLPGLVYGSRAMRPKEPGKQNSLYKSDGLSWRKRRVPTCVHWDETAEEGRRLPMAAARNADTPNAGACLESPRLGGYLGEETTGVQPVQGQHQAAAGPSGAGGAPGGAAQGQEEPGAEAGAAVGVAVRHPAHQMPYEELHALLEGAVAARHVVRHVEEGTGLEVYCSATAGTAPAATSAHTTPPGASVMPCPAWFGGLVLHPPSRALVAAPPPGGKAIRPPAMKGGAVRECASWWRTERRRFARHLPRHTPSLLPEVDPRDPQEGDEFCSADDEHGRDGPGDDEHDRDPELPAPPQPPLPEPVDAAPIATVYPAPSADPAPTSASAKPKGKAARKRAAAAAAALAESSAASPASAAPASPADRIPCCAALLLDGVPLVAFAWGGALRAVACREEHREQAALATEWLQAHARASAFQPGWSYALKGLYASDVRIVPYAFDGLVLTAAVDPNGSELPYGTLPLMASDMGLPMAAPCVTGTFRQLRRRLPGCRTRDRAGRAAVLGDADLDGADSSLEPVRHSEHEYNLSGDEEYEQLCAHRDSKGRSTNGIGGSNAPAPGPPLHAGWALECPGGVRRNTDSSILSVLALWQPASGSARVTWCPQARMKAREGVYPCSWPSGPGRMQSNSRRRSVDSSVISSRSTEFCSYRCW